MDKLSMVNKNISMIYRMGQPYFERKLSIHHIGAGQHFFLLCINELPGISMLELAQKGHYDKGTCNRAVNKLEEQGYVQCISDEKDRRIRRVTVTEKATPIIEDTLKAVEEWESIMKGMIPEEELALAAQVIEKMAENVCAYGRERRKQVLK